MNATQEITGTLVIRIPGANKSQIENATKHTLAVHFDLLPSQVSTVAVESRRLGAAEERRLAGTWTITFVLSAPANKIASINTKQAILQQPGGLVAGTFTAILQIQLLASGLPASAVSSLVVVGVTVTMPGETTSTVLPIGETSDSVEHRCAATALLLLSSLLGMLVHN